MIRVMGSTMLLAAVLTTGGSMYAAPSTALHAGVHAMGKQKDMVSFHLRNDSTQPLVVKAGTQELTLEPGKPVDVTLKVGETVTVARATTSFQEGVVLATVSQDLKNTTIALK